MGQKRDAGVESICGERQWSSWVFQRLLRLNSVRFPGDCVLDRADRLESFDLRAQMEVAAQGSFFAARRKVILHESGLPALRLASGRQGWRRLRGLRPVQNGVEIGVIAGLLSRTSRHVRVPR